ncbi:hypothetical protein ACFVMC_05270 [Nocardia sp. NPDC127579]|uniref:hypothetical protein n=1 Tax=Nocardia sp. NPDC127579 TaxID=3345402 RepID=UPI003634AE9F
MRKFTATSALLIAALGVAAGTAHAEPAAAAPLPVNLSYEIDEKNGSLKLTTDSGSIVTENGRLAIKANNGAVMAGIPLATQIFDHEFPVAATQVADRSVTLTPQLDEQHAVYKPVALPFEGQAEFKNEYEREKAAYSRMKDNIGLAATVAGLTTTVLGGLIGCVGGAALGTAASAPVAFLLGAGPVVGCIVGAAAGASFLGVVGTILITAPIAVVEAVNYFGIINSPFVPPAKK